MIPNNIRAVDYYEAFTMAVQMFTEVEGENAYSPTEWIDYHGINYIETIYKPRRKTLLHEYIHDAYYMGYEYFLDKHFPEEVIGSLLKVFNSYRYKGKDFLRLEEQYKIYTEEERDYEELEDLGYELLSLFNKTIMGLVVDDIFTVLFQNKTFLREFNIEISLLINELKVKDYPTYLSKDGVLNRPSYIPQWLKNGVFYRDKGRCQLCGKDLTRLLNVDNNIHYDHIIPLELGGSNDPTNFQLTCADCNLSKSYTNCNTNDIATPFWELEK